ncbi:MAG TPA: DMT family transporter [Anaerolineales bacterium]|nr:DMT family transporter [Anaerolineales bacterium]
MNGLRAFGILAGLTAAAIWGGMYVVSKVVLEYVSPFTLLTLRLVLGALALGIVLLFRRGTLGPGKGRWTVVGVGVIGFGVSVGLQFVGTSLSSAAHAALITSASPAFILLFGILLLGEPATVPRVAALVVATLGVIAVLNPGGAELGGGSLRGNLALLGASVTWGLYSVLVKQVSRDRTTTEVSLLAFLGGLVVSLPMAAVEGSGLPAQTATAPVLAGILYLGLVSTALAMYLWNRSLAILDAGLVSILFFAQPVVGVALGALILGESLGATFWLGAGLIATGLVLSAVSSGARGRPRSSELQRRPSDQGGQTS